MDIYPIWLRVVTSVRGLPNELQFRAVVLVVQRGQVQVVLENDVQLRPENEPFEQTVTLVLFSRLRAHTHTHKRC